jgi:hypothetical protein
VFLEIIIQDLVLNNLNSILSGSNNLALGKEGLKALRYGSDNIAIGTSALILADSSDNCIAIGNNALSALLGTGNPVVGDNNIAIGHNAGSAITAGSSNVIIGSNTGSTIATSSNNIILSDGDGNIRLGFFGAGKLNLPSYGSGTQTGTLTKTLGVDSSGDVIEVDATTGTVAGTGTAGTITKWATGGANIEDSIITINSTGETFWGSSPKQAYVYVDTTNDIALIGSLGTGMDLGFITGTGTNKLTISSTGVATFSRSPMTTEVSYDYKNIRVTSGFGGGYTVGRIQSLLAGYDVNIYGVDMGYSYNGSGYNLSFSTNDDLIGNPIERLTISSGGNVGIGSGANTLIYPLEVHSADNGDGIIYKDTGASITNWFGAFSGAAVIGATTNHPLSLYAGGGEKMRISSGGEIQVGGDAALIFGTNNTTDPYIQAASSGDELFFGRANGFQMAIRSDNVVDFKTGIRFINGGNDTLDAYEQDTYSPILKGSSTAGSSPTGVGTYTVIGNVCHLNIRFSGVTVTGATGAIAISLPFAGKSINGQTTSNFNTYNVSFTGTNINALYVSGDVLYGLSSVSGTIWADWAIVDASNIYWNLSITYLIN